MAAGSTPARSPRVELLLLLPVRLERSSLLLELPGPGHEHPILVVQVADPLLQAPLLMWERGGNHKGHGVRIT